MKRKFFSLLAFALLSISLSSYEMLDEDAGEGKTAPVSKDCYNSKGQVCSYGNTCGSGGVDCLSNPCNNNC